MCVAEERDGKSPLSVFAWAPQGVCIVVLNMQKGQSTQAENSPGHDGVTFFWNSSSGLQRHEESLFKHTSRFRHGCRESHRLEEVTSGYSLLLPKNCMVAFLKILESPHFI